MAAIDTQGRAAAGVTLPDLPDDCRAQERYRPKVGDEAVAALKLQRRATIRANRRVLRCADFYDTTKSALEAAP